MTANAMSEDRAEGLDEADLALIAKVNHSVADGLRKYGYFYGTLTSDFLKRLIALAQHGQARPGVEPVAWRYKLDEETAAALHRPGWNFQEHEPPVKWGVYGRLIVEAEPLYAAAPALPTTIRGGREEIAAIERLRRVADGEPEYAVYPGPPTPRRKAIRSDLRAVLALPASIGVEEKQGLGSDRCSGTSSDAQSVRPDGGEA